MMKAYLALYSKSLLDKYRDNMPVWVLVEVLNFRELISFYEFYKKRHNHNIEKISTFDLSAIKSLRNIAAHNSCILHTLTMQPMPASEMKISIKLKQFLNSRGLLSRRGKAREIRIPLIHDFLCLILTFSKLCPNTKMRKILIQKIDAYFKRCEEKSKYFKYETLILQRYFFIKKVTQTILSGN